MARGKLSAALTLLAAGAVAVGGSARADDWPQYRRDAWRSATSKDRLQFPLADVWSWTSRGPQGHTPLYHSVVWQDRAVFTASEGQYRYLVCADAKTGRVHWKQQLAAERLKFPISDVAGPAVSAAGRVFVYDWYTAREVGQRRGGLRHTGQGTQSSGAVEPVNTFCVRTFDVRNGEEGDFFPLAAMGANGVLPRLSLLNTPAGQEVRPVPPTFVGCPP